jgi:chemotaxis protein MotB
VNPRATSQIVIFLSVFLGVSLIGNFALFTDQTKKEDELLQLKAEINEKKLQLESQARQQSEKDNQRKSQLDTVNTQQAEFAEIIKQLQTEIKLLQARQIQTAKTGKLTQQQLEKTKNALVKNDQELASAKKELQYSKAIIEKQQRALIDTRQTDDQLSPSATKILELLSQQFANNEEVRLLQSQNSIILNFPVNNLFESTEPILADSAEQWLKPLAEAVKQFSDINVQVIGHSDARPIVSELAKRYPTNWELSTARASRVVSELITLGVSNSVLMAAGKAANEPIRDESDKTSWMINRRIEIIIQ